MEVGKTGVNKFEVEEKRNLLMVTRRFEAVKAWKACSQALVYVIGQCSNPNSICK